MPIKELAESMNFEVLTASWTVSGLLVSLSLSSRMLWKGRTGILTEVDSYDWITFLPMADGGGAYTRYFWQMNTGKMKLVTSIRAVSCLRGSGPS